VPVETVICNQKGDRCSVLRLPEPQNLTIQCSSELEKCGETYDESSWIPVYVCLGGSEFSSEVLVCGWHNLVLWQPQFL
jgi:hypothetical protein